MTRFDAFTQRRARLSQIVDGIHGGLFHREQIQRSKYPDVRHSRRFG